MKIDEVCILIAVAALHSMVLCTTFGCLQGKCSLNRPGHFGIDMLFLYSGEPLTLFPFSPLKKTLAHALYERQTPWLNVANASMIR